MFVFFQILIFIVFSWISTSHPLTPLVTFYSLPVINFFVHFDLKHQSQIQFKSDLLPLPNHRFDPRDLEHLECINFPFTFPQIQHLGIERGWQARGRGWRKNSLPWDIHLLPLLGLPLGFSMVLGAVPLSFGMAQFLWWNCSAHSRIFNISSLSSPTQLSI